MASPRHPKQFVDDRGRRIDPAAVRLQPGVSGVGAPGDPHLADLRMRALVGHTTSQSAITVIAPAIIGAAVGLGVFAAARFVPGLPIWVPMIVVAVLVIAAGSLRAALATERRAAASADLFLREGRCAGCAYVLQGIAPAEDGCVVCPECGAAWSRSRIGSVPDAPVLRDYHTRIYRPTTRQRWLPGSRGMLMTTDARGVAAHVSNPRLRGLDPASAERLGDDRVRAIRSAIGLKHRVKGFLIGLAILPAIVAMGILLSRTRPVGSTIALLGSLGFALFAVAIIIILLGLMYTMLFGDSGLSGKLVAREFVSRHVCPQCLHTLDDATTGEDGVRVCVGCQAAWRTPDQGRQS